ncbi:C40 family peptidase [Pedobacter sp. SD-b]|uniref:C40 family peptidase n=1 Tax=Pedobacter segetis TaxID=2793069 RepID=A0ABS1BFW3_9SPHI|nr:C40 family peptidase [Pedobacter segetis]MBK0381754.1 C40 family peptidase [Pedobacter segetis]
MIKVLFLLFIYLFSNCSGNHTEKVRLKSDENPVEISSTIDTSTTVNKIDTTTKTLSSEIISYAKTLIGVPYKYGSTDINVGLDCSGFITAVYNHFDIRVPRSSVGFTNYGKNIAWQDVEPGDLILFTGTDSTKRIVGHMGIITKTNHELNFIHATSGKAYSVTITPLNKYYQGRFVKVIRIID